MKSYMVRYELMEHMIGQVIRRITHLEISGGGDVEQKLQEALFEFEQRRCLLVAYEQDDDECDETEMFLTSIEWF